MENIETLTTLLRQQEETQKRIQECLKTEMSKNSMEHLVSFYKHSIPEKYSLSTMDGRILAIVWLLSIYAPLTLVKRERLPVGMRNRMAIALNLAPCLVSKAITIAGIRWNRYPYIKWNIAMLNDKWNRLNC